MPWNIKDFNLDDELNQRIWVDSIGAQKKIHEKVDDNQRRFSGNVGIQQALIGDSGFDKDPLPMVPDLVGKNAGKCRDKTVLIVGSAYAPFIHGKSTRNAITHSDYKAASSAAKFQQLFFEEVIARDINYYSVLSSRFDGVSPLNLILTDLCRGSYCCRDVTANGHRSYISGDKIANGTYFKNRGDGRLADEARELFSAYLDAGEEWTWSRLKSARDVVALGTIAEHGLLRLLNKRGATISESTRPDQWREPEVGSSWPLEYADSNKKLSYWLLPGRWWNVSDGNMNWRILPAYHPAAQNRNSLRQNLQRFLGLGNPSIS